MATFGPWSTQDWPPGGVVPSGWASNGTLSTETSFTYRGDSAVYVSAPPATTTLWVDIPIPAEETSFRLHFAAGDAVKAALWVDGVEVYSVSDFSGLDTYNYMLFSAPLPAGTELARFEVTIAASPYDKYMYIDNFGGVEVLPITLRLSISGQELALEDDPMPPNVYYNYNPWDGFGLAASATAAYDEWGDGWTGVFPVVEADVSGPSSWEPLDTTTISGQLALAEAGYFLLISPFELAFPFSTSMLEYDSLYGFALDFDELSAPLTLTLSADTPLGSVQLAQGTVSNASEGLKLTGLIDWSKLLLAPPEFWTMFNQTYEVP